MFCIIVLRNILFQTILISIFFKNWLHLSVSFNRQAFKNIHQMLKPNGTMLLYIIAYHDIYEVLRILAQDIRFVEYVPVNYNMLLNYNYYLIYFFLIFITCFIIL